MKIKTFTVTWIDHTMKPHQGKWSVPDTGKPNHDTGVLIDQLVKDYRIYKIIEIQ